MLPVMGPAVAELLTASATERLLVEALLVSASVPTLVLRLKDASAGLASPEPPSVAAQAMLTLSGCQFPSADPQETTGAFLSTLLPEIGPAVEELPAPSATARLLVEALFVSVFAATEVVKSNEASAGSARPDVPSRAVQAILTSAACHAPSTTPHEILGATVSIFTVAVVAVLVLL